MLMTSIAEISDEPKFTIKAVCDQTGILPVTLRAWERRHAVLKPHRSENRYRLYSEQDVALLLWLKNRLDSGITISVAANELHSMLDNNIWPEAVLPPPRLRSTSLRCHRNNMHAHFMMPWFITMKYVPVKSRKRSFPVST